MTEALQLQGVRVLVTRPRERSEELCFLLEDEGAEVVSLPLLELLPPEDPRPLRAAVERLHRYTWAVLASPSGAQALFEAAREAETLDALARLKLAAVGPKTASAARDLGLNVEIEATKCTAEGLLEDLRPALADGDEVLVPCAQEGRRELTDGLVEAGFRVTRVAAYRSAPAEVSQGEVDSLVQTPPAIVLFASPRTAEAFVELAGEAAPRILAGARIVAIGPTTASALERIGHAATVIAERPTSEGLVDAAIRAVQG